MHHLDDLFQYLLQHKKTIVFGNLSRLPSVINEYIANHLTHLSILVICPFYTYPSSPHVRVIQPAELSACDLLLYIEPFPHAVLHHDIQTAQHLVILTSHMIFIDRYHTCSYLSYFHFFPGEDLESSMEKTKRLKALEQSFLYETDQESKNVISIGPVPTLDRWISPENPDPAPLEKKTRIVIDLTQFQKRPSLWLFHFWTAFDYLLKHLDRIESWKLCFKSSAEARMYKKFVQKWIDYLCCRTFQHGNVLRLNEILSLTPFYKVGTVELPVLFEKKQFGPLAYIRCSSAQEAYRASMRYNLDPVAGSVFRLK